MKNWKALALAQGVEAADVDRVTAPLDALENAFRPLVKSLGPESEPATTFQAEAGGEELGGRR